MTVAVELVYDKACPNVGEARASLRQAHTDVSGLTWHRNRRPPR